MNEVTRVLEALRRGDPQAADQLLPLVYRELRRLAAHKLAGEPPGQTLDATALVHEAYLRLVGDQRFEDRRHFFAACAEAMRRILVERARRKKRLKRGGGLRRAALPDVAAPALPDADVLAVDEALEQLANEEPRKAELVKLRFFAGLSEEEAACCLDISRATAARWWAYARAWLYKRIRDDASSAPSPQNP
jgi:RNA polymerase sigma factor (TIGR02999 family)